MNPEKKQEYLDYIQTLYDDIERVKLMDVPEDELSKEIESINRMIDELKNLIQKY